ncbi:TPA: ATP-binding protein [Yersinia enterocolitica]|nr:ATP-binding protein [Yersinia enterocolitica]
MYSPSPNHQVIIEIPTINDSVDDFTTLFMLFNRVMACQQQQIVFRFTFCVFLRPNAVAFIGGMWRLLQKKNKDLFVEWISVKPAVMASLTQNTFGYTFGHHAKGGLGHAIPYRQDLVEDPNSILNYLTDNWIGKGWMHVSEPLRDAIAGKLWEIYANSFEHSKSPVGVFSCGQHFRRRNELILSVIDFGVGIPYNVKTFLSSDSRASSLPADACLRWACQSGNTTATVNGIPRGLGLHLLKELVKVNNGKLELYSHNGYVKIDSQGEEYQTLPFHFEGTILHITLICDEKFYHLVNE